jgi:D-alanine-D-alanine ligase
MKKKVRVAVLFGGKSAEHDVSLQSAKNIIAAMDTEKYDILPICIDRTGRWMELPESQRIVALGEGESSQKIHHEIETNKNERELVDASVTPRLPEQYQIDVVFPVLHGPMGEDGTMQGLLKIMDVAFVGPDVLSSAVGMDKDVMKRLLRDAGIPIAKFIVLRKNNEKTFE